MLVLCVCKLYIGPEFISSKCYLSALAHGPLLLSPVTAKLTLSFFGSFIFLCGPLEKGMASHRYSCLENPMNNMKRQKDRIPKEELPRSLCAQYTTGDQWRNNSWKNEGMEPKQKQYPAVDVTGDRSKIWCCKEQYCIGTWNVRSMNQGKLGQTSDGKGECRHSRNQRTKMDWNGWI